MNGKLATLKKFLPLIIIFLIIIAATMAKQIFMNARYLSNVTHNTATGLITKTWFWETNIALSSSMYDFMGIFFVVFGLFKIINLNNFAQAYAMYDLIAQRSMLYAFAYPFIELTLGIASLLRWQLWLINWITLILMLINAIGVARALQQGQQLTCACLGMVFNVPMTYVTLAEDLLMAGMAAAMLIMR